MAGASLLGIGVLALVATAPSCHGGPRRFDTRVELVSTRTMGASAGKAPSLIELEMRFVDCPGEVYRVMRGDKALAECAGAMKPGEKVSAVIQMSYDKERENFRDEVVKLGPCDVTLDPKEEANYETVQVCKDLMATGVAVGVHCDKKREGELIAKCPWLKRL
jgi:hypothetical protein